jgi:hypothetical protein
LIWRWAHALFGAWSGVLALFLYTFCPNVLAHAHLVTTDIATTFAMFAATYTFWRYLTAPSRGGLLLAAIAFGGAQLTKATALFLVPIFAVILGVRALRGAMRKSGSARHALAGAARGQLRELLRPALRFLVFGIVALAVLKTGFRFEGTGTPLKRYARFVSPGCQWLAGFPLLRDIPLPLPYPYLQGLDMVSRDSRGGPWSYLRGRYSETGFRSYFLWGFLVKVPLATQILIGFAFWLWGSGRVRAPGAEEFLLVPVLTLLIYFSLRFELDIGFRYLLPVFPFLFVFSARVALPYLSMPAGRRPLWKLLAATTLLAWLAVSSASIHPHYIPYFNEAAGGPANGSRWLIDSNLDWGQDGEYVRDVIAARSPTHVFFDPSGPLAGRIAVSISSLVGRDPGAARRHAWLRDNFQPILTVGHSYEVFDVNEAQLARCCAGQPRAWVLDDLASDLALRGEPFAGGEGVTSRFETMLNDGMLGANEPLDAARTVPPQAQPVRAWFGISWPAPQTIGRVVAFPGFGSRGAMAWKFLALDYVFQFWDGARWRDIPGTRVAGNRALRVEHRFPPLQTTRIRILIDRERNAAGTAGSEGGFRAACLELAAYLH